MRLRTAKDRLKIEHSIIDGVRGVLEQLLAANPAIRSVIPGVIRPVRDARGKIKVRVTVPTQNGWKAIALSAGARQGLFISTEIGKEDLESAFEKAGAELACRPSGAVLCQRSYPLNELLRRKRLQQHSLGRVTKHADYAYALDRRRNVEGLQGWELALHLQRQVQSVEARHHKIDDRDIDLPLVPGGNRQRLLATARFQNGEAAQRKSLPDQPPNSRFVVHNQNGMTAGFRSSRTHGIRRACFRRRERRGQARKEDPERRASSGLAGNGNVPPVLFHDSINHRQTQSRAGARSFRCKERLEDVGHC